MRRIKKWLLLWDGIFTIPLIAIITLVFSILLLTLYGPGVGIFPPGIMTGVFIAAFIFFGGYTAVNALINLNHRGWWNRYYIDKEEIKKDFKKLPPWLRVLFLPLLQLILFLAFLWLVAQLL